MLWDQLTHKDKVSESIARKECDSKSPSSCISFTRNFNMRLKLRNVCKFGSSMCFVVLTCDQCLPIIVLLLQSICLIIWSSSWFLLLYLNNLCGHNYVADLSIWVDSENVIVGNRIFLICFDRIEIFCMDIFSTVKF
jgi:hypothetical protein